MKLPDIDDKYEERAIRIMAGRELVAKKSPGDKYWLVKETSCNFCGECCLDFPGTIYGSDDEGKCNALVKNGKQWECSAGVQVPWTCLDDPHSIDCCSITYRWVK